MSEHDDLVMVARFLTLPGAEAAHAYLEANGIPAVVLEQDVLRIDPLHLEPAHIRVMVRPEDEAIAREALESAGTPFEEAET